MQSVPKATTPRAAPKKDGVERDAELPALMMSLGASVAAAADEIGLVVEGATDVKGVVDVALVVVGVVLTMSELDAVDAVEARGAPESTAVVEAVVGGTTTVIPLPAPAAGQAV